MSNLAGSGCEILVPFNERKPLAEIERNIITKYRRPIWSKFVQALKAYNLVKEGDRVAVDVSGGKDSLLMAKFFQELHKHGPLLYVRQNEARGPLCQESGAGLQ